MTHLAQDITEVPLDFEARNRSTACLLKDAGFPDLRGAVTADEVRAVLRAEPELIDLWLERGDDQRLARGWGLQRHGSGYCLVDFATGDVQTFDDSLEVIAQFIVRYVGRIGDVMARTA